ncbi:hypothetical protein [Vibrio crassostreae]|uniref:hypothetical protein n=1 Tax=Vibrio crassostreae TaxID=246167 RepID=UPI001B3083F3|nr:hypothetical protein [Vibrio crassostreae]
MKKYAIREVGTGEILKLELYTDSYEDGCRIITFTEYSLDTTDGTMCEWMTDSLLYALHVYLFGGDNELTTPTLSERLAARCELISCTTEGNTREFKKVENELIAKIKDLFPEEKISCYDFSRRLEGINLGI